MPKKTKRTKGKNYGKGVPVSCPECKQGKVFFVEGTAIVGDMVIYPICRNCGAVAVTVSQLQSVLTH